MHPVLFQFGSTVIPSYLVMLVLATCALVWLSTALAERNSVPRHHMAFLMLATYAAGLLGARLLFVVEHHWLYADPVRAGLSPVPGGFASHGALLFGALAGILYARRFRLPLGNVADSVILGLCAFGILARLGCFLAGCCYGRPTSLPSGVVFPESSEAAARWGFGVPLHPTQLYEAGYLGCLAALLFLIQKRQPVPGQQLAWLALGYSVARFLNEFARGDSLLEFWSLTPPQWMSIVLVGISLAWLGHRKGRRAYPSWIDNPPPLVSRLI